MTLYLDFDRTLFDTRRFYNALEKDFIFGEKVVSAETVRSFLYEDTVLFLKKQREKGVRLVVVTRGDEKAQGFKVRHSGVEELVDAVFYVPEGIKAAAIQKDLTQGEPPHVFIDDQRVELEAVQEELEVVTPVRMRRETAENSGEEFTGFLEVASLLEFETMLETL